MKSEILKMVTEQMIGKTVDESVIGFKEVTGKLTGNYIKRRNVGFGVISSVAGSVKETKQYYSDVFTGKEPINMIEGIYFIE